MDVIWDPGAFLAQHDEVGFGKRPIPEVHIRFCREEDQAAGLAHSAAFKCCSAGVHCRGRDVAIIHCHPGIGLCAYRKSAWFNDIQTRIETRSGARGGTRILGNFRLKQDKTHNCWLYRVATDTKRAD